MVEGFRFTAVSQPLHGVSGGRKNVGSSYKERSERTAKNGGQFP